MSYRATYRVTPGGQTVVDVKELLRSSKVKEESQEAKRVFERQGGQPKKPEAAMRSTASAES
jgi:hypothetical protein